jgi:hypothetical protein
MLTVVPAAEPRVCRCSPPVICQAVDEVDLCSQCGGLGFGGGTVVELKLGIANADADPVQPEEGPIGPHVEHLEGADIDHQPTGIMNCDLSNRIKTVPRKT